MDLFECIVIESLLETSMYLEFEKANCNYLKELNLNSSTRLSLFGVRLSPFLSDKILKKKKKDDLNLLPFFTLVLC